MKLLVFLGNPGKEYEYTRHNAGFLCFDELTQILDTLDTAKQLGTRTKKEYEAHTYQLSSRLKSETVTLLKPLTYMNRSGEVVREYLKTIKEPFTMNKDAWIIHDDIALPLGTLRLDKNKSAGGHNGVENIITHLKTKDMIRFRVGILAGTNRSLRIEEYVLKKYSRTELAIIKNMAVCTAEKIIEALNMSIPFVQQKVNRHVFFKCN